ncbi:MAG: hypothetical protein PHD48_01820 [Alphaproteobacteria bacterium]|nr:hypothetical protein [Alphaproteobacteria bacterium]
MAEQTDNLVFELLRVICFEQADLRMTAIAIDEHTNRRNRIESHCNSPQTLA